MLDMSADSVVVPVLELNEDENTLDGLAFVVESGSGRHKGYTVIRILEPETENYQPRVCDVTHILLWNTALRLWRFFKATQELDKPGIAERWAMVEDFVLKGSVLDESVLDKSA